MERNLRSAHGIVGFGISSSTAAGGAPSRASELDAALTEFANSSEYADNATMKKVQELVKAFEGSTDKQAALMAFYTPAMNISQSFDEDWTSAVVKLNILFSQSPAYETAKAELDAVWAKFVPEVHKLTKDEQQKFWALYGSQSKSTHEEWLKEMREYIASVNVPNPSAPGLLEFFNQQEVAWKKVGAAMTAEMSKVQQLAIDNAVCMNKVVEIVGLAVERSTMKS